MSAPGPSKRRRSCSTLAPSENCKVHLASRTAGVCLAPDVVGRRRRRDRETIRAVNLGARRLASQCRQSDGARRGTIHRVVSPPNHRGVSRRAPTGQIGVETRIRDHVLVSDRAGTMTLAAAEQAHVPARAAVVGISGAVEASALADDVGKLALARVARTLVPVGAVVARAATLPSGMRAVAILNVLLRRWFAAHAASAHGNPRPCSKRPS
jgi:hypothetical protein